MEATMSTPTEVKPTRAELREKILATKKPKVKLVDFHGVEIELRQPVLGDIIAAQANEDRTAAIIDTMIRYAFVPGTEERVFEAGDVEQIKQMPFDHNLIAISKAMEELSEVNFLEPKPNSGV